MRPRESDRGEGIGPRLTLGSTTSVPALLLKIVVLGGVAGALVGVTPVLVAVGDWMMLCGAWIIAALLFAVYAGRRRVPAKYLLPGAVFLAVFVVVPIAFNVQISTTNFGDGARGTKEQAIASIVAGSFAQPDDAVAYTMAVARPDADSDGELVLLLVDPRSGEALRGTGDGLTVLSPSDATVRDGRVTAASGLRILSPKEVNAVGDRLRELVVPVPGGGIRAQGISNAVEGAPTLTYSAEDDVLRDRVSGDVFHVEQIGDRSYFVRADGTRAFDQSWQESAGASNYLRLLTDPVLRDSFGSAFLWSLVFSVGSVAISFGIGLFLASTLDDPFVRGRRLYRAALIIPYAIPTFISFLVWSTFYNQDFGLINAMLGGARIDWLGDPVLAKGAVMLANVWSSFPYMFLICTGALQSLPRELDEAAALDGAGPVRTFFGVRFPLLLIAVAPLLVAAFAFNFNNFNAIQLLTGGGPFDPGSQIGHTDILISAVYRLAFGDSGARFGLAAAGSTVLFVITAALAAVQFRATRQWEDLR